MSLIFTCPKQLKQLPRVIPSAPSSGSLSYTMLEVYKRKLNYYLLKILNQPGCDGYVGLQGASSSLVDQAVNNEVWTFMSKTCETNHRYVTDSGGNPGLGPRQGLIYCKENINITGMRIRKQTRK